MRYRAFCAQFAQMMEQQANEFAETEKSRIEELHERALKDIKYSCGKLPRNPRNLLRNLHTSRY